MEPKRRLFIAGLMVLVIFSAGVLGYKLFMPSWSWVDALYMTAITLATVGYSDYGMTQPARIFTVALVITGIGAFTFGVTSLIGFVVEGQLSDVLRQRRMEKGISRLEGHYIICGAGDTGLHLIDAMLTRKAPFVVVDRDVRRLRELLNTREFLYVEGEATDDDVLRKAGIEKARCLISMLPDDRDNLFVVLSARTLNPQITLVSKAVDPKSVAKLRKAGVDHVIMPDYLGGLRIASLLVRPNVVDFIDEIRFHPVYRLVEAKLARSSPLVGKRLRESDIRRKTGLSVLAIRRGREIIYNPSPELTLMEGDGIVVIGSRDQVAKLGEIVGDDGLAERWFK